MQLRTQPKAERGAGQVVVPRVERRASHQHFTSEKNKAKNPLEATNTLFMHFSGAACRALLLKNKDGIAMAVSKEITTIGITAQKGLLQN